MTAEAEGYSSSVAGIDIEAVRAGPGGTSTQVLAAVGDRFTFTSSTVGFPMLSQTTIPDDKIIAGYIRTAKPGSRWCGIDLRPGSVVLESPGAEHTAHNEPELEFSFAITDLDLLAQHADALGMRLEPPPRGEVRCLRVPATTEVISEAFETFADIAASGTYPPKHVGDGVLRALAHAVADQHPAQRVGRGKCIDPRHIVHTCRDYVDSIGRIPSISELCLAAHVSERCLRSAFTAEYDTSPTRYFRAWALERARRILLHADGADLTVTDVATGLGLTHLGRFAVRYREVYAEPPSATLSSAAG